MLSPSLLQVPTHSEHSSDQEVADIGFSLGVINGRFSLRRSTWQRVRQIFHQNTVTEQVDIAGGNAFIHVPAADEGFVQVYMRVVNFSPVPIHLEHLLVDYVSVSGRNISAPSPQLYSHTQPIARRSGGTCTFQIQLLPGGVRELRGAVRRASNDLSSPDASLSIRGQLILGHKRDRSRIAFQLDIPTPQLNFSQIVAGDG